MIRPVINRDIRRTRPIELGVAGVRNKNAITIARLRSPAR
jgi:hypothetical protein